MNALDGLSQVAEDEVEQDDVPNVLKRSAAFKAPYNPYEDLGEFEGDEDDMDEEDDIAEGEEPDLRAFFSMFPWIEEHSQIALCRTYANYLANKIKVRKQ